MDFRKAAYRNRVRLQSRDITAFETTAYFKKKEKPSCDKQQLDLNSYYQLECVRSCSDSTNKTEIGIEKLTQSMCALEIPVADYCTDAWNRLNNCGVSDNVLLKHHSWLNDFSKTDELKRKRFELALSTTIARLHEVRAIQRLYSVCLSIVDKHRRTPYLLFELLEEASACSDVFTSSVTQQANAIELDLPFIRERYIKQFYANSLPGHDIDDYPAEFGMMPTNAIPVFPASDCYRQFQNKNGASLQDLYGSSYNARYGETNDSYVVRIPYWKNKEAFSSIQQSFLHFASKFAMTDQEREIIFGWNPHMLAHLYLERLDQYVSYRISDCYPTLDSTTGSVYWSADKIDSYAFLSLFMEICNNTRTQLCPICNELFYQRQDRHVGYCSYHSDKQKETYRRKLNQLNGEPSDHIIDEWKNKITHFNIKVFFRSPLWPLGYQLRLTNETENLFWLFSPYIEGDLERMQEKLITFDAVISDYHQEIYTDLQLCYEKLGKKVPEKYNWLLTGCKQNAILSPSILQKYEHNQNWLAANVILSRLNEYQKISFLYEECLKEIRLSNPNPAHFLQLLDMASSVMYTFEDSIARQFDYLEIEDPIVQKVYRGIALQRAPSLQPVSVYRDFCSSYKWPEELQEADYLDIKKSLGRIAATYTNSHVFLSRIAFDTKKLAETIIDSLDPYISEQLRASQLTLRSANRSADWTTARLDTYAYLYLYLEICSFTHFKICPICNSTFICDSYHPNEKYCSLHTKRQIEQYRKQKKSDTCDVKVMRDDFWL